LPVRTCQTYSGLAAGGTAARDTERRLLDEAGSAAASGGGPGGGGGGGGLNRIDVEADAALDPPPGACSQTEKGFGRLSPIQSTASFCCVMPKSALCSQARCAPAHTAMFFWKVLNRDSAASLNSWTRVHTESMSVPWGTFRTHQGHSGSEHARHDMGQDSAQTRRHGAGVSAGRRSGGEQRQPQQACAEKSFHQGACCALSEKYNA